MSETEKPVVVYTIIHTFADLAKGIYPRMRAAGAYPSLCHAQAALSALVEQEKDSRDFHCGSDDYREEYGTDFWDAYESGNAAANFSRFDILDEPFRCSHAEAETLLFDKQVSTESGGAVSGQ